MSYSILICIILLKTSAVECLNLDLFRLSGSFVNPDKIRNVTENVISTMRCAKRCARYGDCVTFIYLQSKTCITYISMPTSRYRNVLYTGPVYLRGGKTPHLSEKIISAVYYEGPKIYIVVRYLKGAATVMFFKDQFLNLKSSFIASYDWTSVFPQPDEREVDTTGWDSSDEACMYQGYNDEGYHLVICRGMSCGSYLPLDKEKFSTWALQQFSTGVYPPDDCSITFENYEADFYLMTNFAGPPSIEMSDEDYTFASQPDFVHDTRDKLANYYLKDLLASERFFVIIHQKKDIENKSAAFYDFIYIKSKEGVFLAEYWYTNYNVNPHVLEDEPRRIVPVYVP